MEKLRVNRGIEIEVNDNNEIICIPIDDMTFIDNFSNLLTTFEKVNDEVKAKEGELEPREELKFVIEKTKHVMDEINNLFRDERCCEKVFGRDAVPSPWLIADFFDKLCPFVEKHANNRQKEIMEKYKKRKGK